MNKFERAKRNEEYKLMLALMREMGMLNDKSKR